MQASFQCRAECKNFARDPLFKLTNQHHPADKHVAHWTKMGRPAGRPRGGWMWATDVLRQSHKSVFVAKLEKYVRKQMAAKRRRLQN